MSSPSSSSASGANWSGRAADSLDAVGWSARVQAAFAPSADAGLQPARVVAVERGGWCQTVAASRALQVVHHSLAVGDWIGVDVDGRVASTLDRWSALERRDPDGGTQVLAANVDVVLVVAPADRVSLARVERELVVAWDSGARPVVVVTKSDLAVDGQIDALVARLARAEVVVTSASTGDGLDTLADLLTRGVTAVALGPSGAGKSTLVNALLGEERLAVGAVRTDDRRGRHTTTSRRLVGLPSGGCFIDMPGLRSLGTDAGDASLAAAFEDIEELAASCRFADCAHDAEPGCEVTAALADGRLDPARWASYGKLARELAHEQRREDPEARQAATRLWRARAREQRQRRKEEGRDDR